MGRTKNRQTRGRLTSQGRRFLSTLRTRNILKVINLVFFVLVLTVLAIGVVHLAGTLADSIVSATGMYVSVLVIVLTVLLPVIFSQSIRARAKRWIEQEFGNVRISIALAIILIICVRINVVLFAPSVVGSPASDGQIGVLIAKFERTGGAEYEPDIDMVEVLDQAAVAVGNVQIISYGQTIANREEAQQLSQQYNATLVVYGRVSPGGVTVHYAIFPRNEETIAELGGNVRVARNDVDDFEAFLYNGLDVNYILGFTTGQLQYFQANYEQALAAFTIASNALDRDRLSELQADVLLTYRGHTLERLGRYDEAIENYDQALSLNQRCAACLYGRRGRANMLAGNYEAAIIDFTSSISFDSSNGDIFGARGDAYYEASVYAKNWRDAQNQLEKAINDYVHAISLKPEDYMYVFVLENAYLQKGRVDSALGDFRLAISAYEHALALSLPTEPNESAYITSVLDKQLQILTR